MKLRTLEEYPVRISPPDDDLELDLEAIAKHKAGDVATVTTTTTIITTKRVTAKRGQR